MGHAHSAHHETNDEAAPESVEIAEVGGSQGEADLAQGREAAEVSSGSSAKEAAEGIQWFEGIKEDIRVRLPLLKSDWDLSDANLLKIFSATMFAYFSESSQIHILNRIDFLKVSGQSIPGPCSTFHHTLYCTNSSLLPLLLLLLLLPNQPTNQPTRQPPSYPRLSSATN